MMFYKCCFAGLGVLAFAAQVGLVSAQVGLPGAAVDDALTVQPLGTEPVARIDGKVVTRDELTSFAIQLEQAEGERVSGGEQLLNEYILTKLYEQIPTTATVEGADEETTAPTEYTSMAQRGLLKRELRAHLSETIDVPREDLEAWYQQNVSKYEKPERIHAYHIFMETSEDTPSSAPEQVRSRLQELKGQIDTGTSFSEAAMKHSEAASSESGGEIGWISRRMPIGPLSKPMNVELENQLFELTPGKVSDVVDTRHGMHLLYVTDRESTRTPSLDDMISSGILPGAVAQDRLTSELRTLVQSTVEKYNGEPLPGGTGDITTDTVAFQFDGKEYLISHLNDMFGPRFTAYLQSTLQDPEAAKSLMAQALEDEAMVRAAIDRGVAEKPEIARQLEQLGQRETARKRINAIAEAEAEVTDEQVKARYDQMIEQLRIPEAEGYLVMISSEEATGTAEQARARELASRKAEELRAELTPENFTSVTRQLAVRSDVRTSVTEIPRHAIGQSTDTMARVFDQVVSRIQAESGLSDVTPLANDFAIAYLTTRYPGEPVELEVIEERLRAMLEDVAVAESRQNMVKRLEERGLVEFLQGAAEFGKQPETGPGDAETTSSGDNVTTSSE